MEETYYFDHLFQLNRKITVPSLENMNREIEQLIHQIKSKNLSPIEEIMMVYDYVKQFEFAKKDNSLEVRQLDSVLNFKKAVCAGFSNVFNTLLLRMGYKAATLECYIEGISHMYSIVEVIDHKYDINGIYSFDPALDSLDKNNYSIEQREDSYAFFGGTVDDLKNLRKQRISRGCSIAITKGNSDQYQEIAQEIPLRTMNIINGFFPSQESYNYLKTIYQKGKDKSTWESLNQPYLFQLFQLGFKARDTERISLNTLEHIIYNVRKISHNSITEEELGTRMVQLKNLNNKLFDYHYNDSRLQFKVVPKNYVDKSQYKVYQSKMNQLLLEKKENESLLSTFTFLNNQDNQVVHTIQKMQNFKTEILLEGVFTADYDFGNKFLVPSLEQYIQYCTFPTGKINPPEYLNYNTRDYIVHSNNGFTLSIQAGNLNFLESLDAKVKNPHLLQQEIQSKEESYSSKK